MEINNTFNAFGWTLMHSIWQAAIVVCVLSIILFIGKHALSSNSRYVLLVVSLLILFTWSLNTYWGFVTAEPVVSANAETFVFDDYFPVASSYSLIENVESFINKHMDYIILGWVAGLVLSVFRFSAGVWGVSQLRKTYSPLASLKTTLQDLKSELGITLDIKIGESVRTKVPVVLGHLQPMILFPVEFITGIERDHIRLIIAHELAHIKRNDYLVNIIQRIIEVIYFFNPFVWWLSNKIKIEREFACDDMVIRMSNPNVYAKALLSSYDQVLAPSLTMGFNGNKQSLASRLNRIMNRNMKNEKRGNLLSLSALVLLIAGFLWTQKNDLTNTNELDKGIRYASMMGEPSVEVAPVGFYIDLDGFQYLDTIPDIKKKEVQKKSNDWEEKFDYSFRFPKEDLAVMLDLLVDIDIPDIVEITPPDFDFDFNFKPNLDFNFNPTYLYNFGLDTIPIKMKSLEESLRSMEMHQRELQEYFENNEQVFMEYQEMASRLQLQLEERLAEIEIGQFEELKKLEGMGEVMEEMFSKQMKELEEQLKHLPKLEGELERMEEVLKEELKHLEEFEMDIKKELKKDGYWDEGDNLELEFGEDYLEINDEKIEGKEFEKYLKIKNKYFPKDKGIFRYKME